MIGQPSSSDDPRTAEPGGDGHIARDAARTTDVGAAAADGNPAPAASVQREIGGRDGPEPTRYGDWEKNGRCIDF